MTILQIHIVAASAWIGLIAAEVVIELLAHDTTTRRFVAQAHKRIDLFFEGPLVAIVLLTGSVLLYRLWPSATPLLLLKVVIGLIAVVSNVVCIHWVLGRARAVRQQCYTDERMV
jgi:uncharacterized membrane protein